MEIKVRRATKDDVKQIAKYAMKLVDQHVAYDEQRFARMATVEGMEWFYWGQVGAKNVALLVAELGDEVVGFAYLAYEAKSYVDLAVSVTSLHDIYVDEAGTAKRCRPSVDGSLA